MRIVIENLPHGISEEEIREELSPFVSSEKIRLINEGNMPAALIEMDMTGAQADALAARIEGRVHRGQRLHAWVPLWRE